MTEKSEKIKVTTTYEDYKELKEAKDTLKTVLEELKRLQAMKKPDELEIKLEVNYFREQIVDGKAEKKKPIVFTCPGSEAGENISKRLWNELQAMQLLADEIQRKNYEVQRYKNIPKWVLRLFNIKF